MHCTMHGGQVQVSGFESKEYERVGTLHTLGD